MAYRAWTDPIRGDDANASDATGVRQPDGSVIYQGEHDKWVRSPGNKDLRYTQDEGSTWEKTSRADAAGQYGMQGNDPRNYMYGRTATGADEAVGRAWETGDRAAHMGERLLADDKTRADTLQNRRALATDWANQNTALGQSTGYGRDLAGLEAVEGRSAAQSQLQAGTNAALANQMSMARSGRGFGGGAAAAGLAQAGAAQTMANQTNAAATLRAQEQANWRTRQAANLTGAADIYGRAGLQYGDQAQFETDAGYKNRTVNDAAAADWARMGHDAYFKGADTSLAGDKVGADIRGKEMEGGLGFERNQLEHWAAENNLTLAGQARQDRKEAGYLAAGGAAVGSFVDNYLGTDGSDVRGKTRIVADDKAGSDFARGRQALPVDTYRAGFGDDLTFDGALYRPRFAPMTADERGRVRQDLDDDRLGSRPSGFRGATARPIDTTAEPVTGSSGARAGSSEPRTVTAGGQKIEIRQPDLEALDAARNAPGSFYNYKDPNAPGADGARHYGPMAQDLAKTPAGRTAVTTLPDGKLGVDTGRLSLVNTSAVSAQQKQIDDMASQLDALLQKQAGGGTELAEYGNRGAAGARGYRAAR
jgi:hypothetical protein